MNEDLKNRFKKRYQELQGEQNTVEKLKARLLELRKSPVVQEYLNLGYKIEFLENETQEFMMERARTEVVQNSCPHDVLLLLYYYQCIDGKYFVTDSKPENGYAVFSCLDCNRNLEVPVFDLNRFLVFHQIANENSLFGDFSCEGIDVDIITTRMRNIYQSYLLEDKEDEDALSRFKKSYEENTKLVRVKPDKGE